MIEYWLQNGEAYLSRNEIDLKKIKKKDIKNAIMPLFQADGKTTIVSNSIFRPLMPNIRRRYDMKKGKTIGHKEIARFIYDSLTNLKGHSTCSICGLKEANKIKGWIFPFIIVKDKFPNLYPSGKVESLTLCKKCAIKSILGYNGLFFNSQGQNISMLFFFSNSFKNLNKILQNHLPFKDQRSAPNFFRNIDLGGAIIYFPHEFTMYLLYNVALRVRNLKYASLPYELNAVVMGLASKGQKKVFYDVSIINRLEIIVKALSSFINKCGAGSFLNMFRLMRMNRPDEREARIDQFVERENFLRYMLRYKKVNWNSALNMVFYRARFEQRINFINMFITSFLEVVRMSEKALYDRVSGMGYALGKAILKKEETAKKAKRHVYELRRARRLSEFLDKINRIQLSIEVPIDDRPFREYSNRFEDLKSMFIINMCNALFEQSNQPNRGGNT